MQFKYLTLLSIVCLVTILSTSCKESKKSDSQENNTAVLTQSQALPPVPTDFLYELYEKVDHIDYFFRYTNFSISQDEKPATQGFISTLSPGAAKMYNDTCRSPLRLTFLSEGNILCETEMYMTENCQYVEYFIDNKKTYRSSHSEEGYNFIRNIYQQAENARRPQQ